LGWSVKGARFARATSRALRVAQALGFRVYVSTSGFRVRELVFALRIVDSGFQVQESGFGVQGG